MSETTSVGVHMSIIYVGWDSEKNKLTSGLLYIKLLTSAIQLYKIIHSLTIYNEVFESHQALRARAIASPPLSYVKGKSAITLMPWSSRRARQV